MTADEFAALLTRQGLLHKAEEVDHEGKTFTDFRFRIRGTALRSVVDSSDPSFFTISATWPISSSDEMLVRNVANDINENYKVVKVVASRVEDGFIVTAAAEQFHSDISVIETVFWRTAEVVMSAGWDAVRRLEPADGEEAET